MKYYDTNALLELMDKAFENEFAISSKTIEELESIKVSQHKDSQIKYQARKVCHLLDEYYGEYKIKIMDIEHYTILEQFNLPVSNDNLIIAGCFLLNKIESIEFITNDIACRVTAREIFGLESNGTDINNSDEDYKGFKEVDLSDSEMAQLYQDLTINTYDNLINEYLVINDFEGVQKDVLKWNGEKYSPIFNKTVKTMSFGDKIKAKDIYQQMVFDSIFSNTITAISGHAGSGKSLLSLVSAMSLIENGKYDRLVILFNPSKAKGAEDMGFYSGSALDKAMQNSIGQILTTKFGDRFAVDVMLQQGKIKLVSMADARGMEINDNEILYITECQNTSAELLKLCLTRVSQGAKVIIEGDYDTQVDSYAFEGNKNGMKRAIEVLKGEDIFGFVELQNVWRSKIASLVDKM